MGRYPHRNFLILGCFALVQRFSCIPEVELGHNEATLFQTIQGISDGSWGEGNIPHHLVQRSWFAILEEGEYCLS